VSRNGMPGREASRAMALTLGATLDANSRSRSFG
jgi:hypothetical protein